MKTQIRNSGKLIGAIIILFILSAMVTNVFAANSSTINASSNTPIKSSQPSLCGTVASKGTDGFMLALSNGQNGYVLINSATTFWGKNQAASYSDLTVGMNVCAFGPSSGTMTIIASRVYLNVSTTAPSPTATTVPTQTRFCGVASSKSSDGFYLTLANGQVIHILVNSATIFRYMNPTTGSYSDLANGMYVCLGGTSSGTMTIVASEVSIYGFINTGTATPHPTYPASPTATTVPTQPKFCGVAGNKGTDGFYLTLSNGQVIHVLVNSATTFSLNAQTVTFAALANGMYVCTSGPSSGEMTIVASRVSIYVITSTATATPHPTYPASPTATTVPTQPKFCGVAGSKGTDGFYLTLSNGQVIHVLVNSATTFSLNAQTVTFAALANGMYVCTSGPSSGTMTIVASRVSIYVSTATATATAYPTKTPNPTVTSSPVTGSWTITSLSYNGVSQPPYDAGKLVLNADHTYTFASWTGYYEMSNNQIYFTGGLAAWGTATWDGGSHLSFAFNNYQVGFTKM